MSVRLDTWPSIMVEAILASGADVITSSLRRQDIGQAGDRDFWSMIQQLDKHALPNTAGGRSAKEAVTVD